MQLSPKGSKRNITRHDVGEGRSYFGGNFILDRFQEASPPFTFVLVIFIAVVYNLWGMNVIVTNCRNNKLEILLGWLRSTVKIRRKTWNVAELIVCGNIGTAGRYFSKHLSQIISF